MQDSTTVIIPVYNRQVTIGRAIDSVLNQTHPADEVIVVDDGSTDDTKNIINSYGNRIRYFTQPNYGVSSARNTGIRNARGDWLAFLDSDDCWVPEKLAFQLEAARKQPGCRIVHTDELWIRNGKRVNQKKYHRKSGGMIYEMCLPRCVISPSSVMIHHSIFSEYGLFSEDLPACEDYEMWLRICRTEPVHFIDKPLIYKYGGHDDQLSRSFPAMDRFRVRVLMEQLAFAPLLRSHLHALLQVLIKKLEILENGSWKRGSIAAARYYHTQKNDAIRKLRRITETKGERYTGI